MAGDSASGAGKPLLVDAKPPPGPRGRAGVQLACGVAQRADLPVWTPHAGQLSRDLQALLWGLGRQGHPPVTCQQRTDGPVLVSLRPPWPCTRVCLALASSHFYTQDLDLC